MKQHRILKLLLVVTTIHILRKERITMNVFFQKKILRRSEKEIYLRTCRKIIQDLNPQLLHTKKEDQLLKEIEDAIDDYHLPKDSRKYHIGLTKRQGRLFQKAYIEQDFQTCFDILKHPIVECL